ncbi:helix-turn-helix domain-containing protein [Amycolatopsis sp. NPDC059027]|uniref:helix-turn-helix domain-containing protein n=1 Tax=unclassified Amycolatopsis TaxID=2618356 RepID=UPI00367278FF
MIISAARRTAILATNRAAGRDLGSLSALLGVTRARVLEATEAGCTTTELSRRVGVSAASASYHASILRAAGLIATRRTGIAVRHEITVLGAHLLTGRRGGGRSAGCGPER